MIRIRELDKRDAPFMLEWMHDEVIQQGFQKDMMKLDLTDAEQFCVEARVPVALSEGDNVHYAIVDEKDEYLGTISLKNVSVTNKSAEYAIVIRRNAQRKGIAKQATGLLLERAFKEYQLNRVYLNVLSDNSAAIRLYEKCGFRLEGEFRQHIYIRNRYRNLKYYGLLASEFDETLYVQ